MGTRADFYVGQGIGAEWLGSIAWDGHPDGVPGPIFDATSETDYRERVEAILATDKSATRPADGWPWPWTDSRTTDYAYTWDGRVLVSSGGRPYVDRQAAMAEGYYDSPKQEVFPDMTNRQRVTLGPRSGITIVSRS